MSTPPLHRSQVMPRRRHLLIMHFAVVLCLLVLVSASSDIKVVVYNGPRKCSNKGTEDKPTKIEKNHVVGLHFTVTIVNEDDYGSSSPGRKIESSRDGVGIAPSFTVGQGKVIAGLDQGLIGLCKGSSAYIIVPPNLAYGRIGKPEQGVLSNTILQYDVEILDIQPPVPNDFVKIDSNMDWEISIDEAREYFEKLGQMVNLDTLWNDEDTNGDGYISWEEFKGPKGSDPPPKIPPKQTKKEAKQQQHHQQSKQGSNNIASIAQRMDTDKDGLISKAELAAVFEEAGSKMTEEFWAESDPDGDGFITFDEFLGYNRALEKGDEL